MTVTFEKRKKDFLSKPDKSSIKAWDKLIVGLCRKLNKRPNYYTLSSCSGRIVLIKNIHEKKHGLFLFKSHEKTSIKELKKALGSVRYKGSVMFKQESCILHVGCKNLKAAHELLIKAQKAGWKQSGILAISSNRIVCELRSTETLALPIVEKGKILVDDNFLKILVREANARLARTLGKINKLEKII